MKVLFVASKNTFRYCVGDITPQVMSPANALLRYNIQIEYFLIVQKGIIGYTKAIFGLTKYINRNADIDLVHAHNGLSGLVCALAFHRKPIVTSFTGSDLLGYIKINGYSFLSKILFIVHNIFILFRYSQVIVKSGEMKERVFAKWKCKVIPNGVDLNIFYPIPRENARKHLGISMDKKIVLFAADPLEPVKNIKLAKEVFNKIRNINKQFIAVFGVTQNELNYYYNSSNVLLLTSYHEGSPNVIKEALACNLSIVSVEVGDVNEQLSKIQNCFIVKREPAEIAKIIDNIFINDLSAFDGRDFIYEKISDKITGKEILDIYSSLLQQ